MTYALPQQYKWLAGEAGPKMIIEGLKILGTREFSGPADNPVIIQWAVELNIKDYNHDAIFWCGLAMAVVAYRAGKPIPTNPLWALNWAKFGIHVDIPMLGDVLVYKRTGGGHVGLYVGEDQEAYHTMGGNQSDMYKISRIEKSRLFAARRPVYVVQPANVRQIFLLDDGNLSKNES